MDELFLRLQKCASSKGVNMAEISRETGLEHSSLSRYFSGASTPKSRDLLTLARYFGVSMEWLLVGEEERDRQELEKGEKRIEEQKAKLDKLATISKKLDELNRMLREATEEDSGD